MTRLTATTQLAIGGGNAAATRFGVLTTLPAETLAGAINIAVTLQSNTASDDVTVRTLAVEFLPAVA